MDVDTKTRQELKGYFVRNSIPTEEHFAQLIEGTLNQKDDGIVKLPDNPLRVDGPAEFNGAVTARDLYLKADEQSDEKSLEEFVNEKIGDQVLDKIEGPLTITDNLTVEGVIIPAAGADEDKGIVFPDPSGDNGDGAWIRYHNEREDEEGTLEIGIGNDSDNHIVLWPGGNIGIDTDWPKSKLAVSGGVAIGIGYAEEYEAPDDTLLVEGQIGIGTTELGDHRLKVDGPAEFNGAVTARDLYLKADEHSDEKSLEEFVNEKIGGQALDEIEGPLTITNNLTVKGAIIPAAGAGEDKGIMFPKDPFRGWGDAAWIRYHNERGGEKGTLEIGMANDRDDHIVLKTNGNIGVNTDEPQSKLAVAGGVAIGTGYAKKHKARDDTLLVEGKIGIGTYQLGDHQLKVQGSAHFTDTVTATDVFVDVGGVSKSVSTLLNEFKAQIDKLGDGAGPAATQPDKEDNGKDDEEPIDEAVSGGEDEEEDQDETTENELSITLPEPFMKQIYLGMVIGLGYDGIGQILSDQVELMEEKLGATGEDFAQILRDQRVETARILGNPGEEMARILRDRGVEIAPILRDPETYDDLYIMILMMSGSTRLLAAQGIELSDESVDITQILRDQDVEITGILRGLRAEIAQTLDDAGVELAELLRDQETDYDYSSMMFMMSGLMGMLAGQGIEIGQILGDQQEIGIAQTVRDELESAQTLISEEGIETLQRLRDQAEVTVQGLSNQETYDGAYIMMMSGLMKALASLGEEAVETVSDYLEIIPEILIELSVEIAQTLGEPGEKITQIFIDQQLEITQLLGDEETFDPNNPYLMLFMISGLMGMLAAQGIEIVQILSDQQGEGIALTPGDLWAKIARILRKHGVEMAQILRDRGVEIAQILRDKGISVYPIDDSPYNTMMSGLITMLAGRAAQAALPKEEEASWAAEEKQHEEEKNQEAYVKPGEGNPSYERSRNKVREVIEEYPGEDNIEFLITMAKRHGVREPIDKVRRLVEEEMSRRR